MSYVSEDIQDATLARVLTRFGKFGSHMLEGRAKLRGAQLFKP